MNASNNNANNNANSNIRELLLAQMYANDISPMDVLEWLGIDDNVCDLIHEELSRMSNADLSGVIAQMLQDQAKTVKARARYEETKRLVLEKLEDNLYEIADFLGVNNH